MKILVGITTSLHMPHLRNVYYIKHFYVTLAHQYFQYRRISKVHYAPRIDVQQHLSSSNITRSLCNCIYNSRLVNIPNRINDIEKTYHVDSSFDHKVTSSIIIILKIALSPRTYPLGTLIFKDWKFPLCAAHLVKCSAFAKISHTVCKNHFILAFLPFAHMHSTIGHMRSAFGQT